jgi:hypothetical protein
MGLFILVSINKVKLFFQAKDITFDKVYKSVMGVLIYKALYIRVYKSNERSYTRLPNLGNLRNPS